MTTRDAIADLLPKVREEIRQLQELEAVLARVAAVPTTLTSSAPPVAVVAVEATVAPPAPAPRRPLVGDWTNAERRAAEVQLLRMRGPMRVADLARELDAAQGHVQTDMEALLKTGHVVRVEHGTYAAPEVVWSGADRAPLADVESEVFARRSA